MKRNVWIFLVNRKCSTEHSNEPVFTVVIHSLYKDRIQYPVQLVVEGRCHGTYASVFASENVIWESLIDTSLLHKTSFLFAKNTSSYFESFICTKFWIYSYMNGNIYVKKLIWLNVLGHVALDNWYLNFIAQSSFKAETFLSNILWSVFYYMQQQN